MSTFINGYRSASPIAEFHRDLVGMRERMAEVGGRIIDKAIANEVANRFDRISTGRTEAPEGQETARHIASAVFKATDERFLDIARSGHRDPGIDTSFELYLFPDGDRTLPVTSGSSASVLNTKNTGSPRRTFAGAFIVRLA